MVSYYSELYYGGAPVIDKLSAGSLATAGVVVGYFIMQSWSRTNRIAPSYFGEVPPTGSPEDVESMIAESDFNKGEDGRSSGGEGYPYADGETYKVVPPDVKTGQCPAGYQLVKLQSQRGPVYTCREIKTD